MSTYGGDSWVPETQNRKRRVDELLGEEIPEDEVRRMSNGRFACLVCPQCPVLDTMPMMHMHRKGARHQTAAEKQLFKKQRLHNEIQKRIALGKMVAPTTSPQVERKHASVFATTKDAKRRTLGIHLDVRSTEAHNISKLAPRSKKDHAGPYSGVRKGTTDAAPALSLADGPDVGDWKHSRQKLVSTRRPIPSEVEPLPINEDQKRRQRELRLQESGWKRDGAGGWVRDENVEFDSDEEAPEGV